MTKDEQGLKWLMRFIKTNPTLTENQKNVLMEAAGVLIVVNGAKKRDTNV